MQYHFTRDIDIQRCNTISSASANAASFMDTEFCSELPYSDTPGCSIDRAACRLAGKLSMGLRLSQPSKSSRTQACTATSPTFTADLACLQGKLHITSKISVKSQGSGQEFVCIEHPQESWFNAAIRTAVRRPAWTACWPKRIKQPHKMAAATGKIAAQASQDLATELWHRSTQRQMATPTAFTYRPMSSM